MVVRNTPVVDCVRCTHSAAWTRFLSIPQLLHANHCYCIAQVWKRRTEQQRQKGSEPERKRGKGERRGSIILLYAWWCPTLVYLLIAMPVSISPWVACFTCVTQRHWQRKYFSGSLCMLPRLRCLDKVLNIPQLLHVNYCNSNVKMESRNGVRERSEPKRESKGGRIFPYV